MQPYKMPDPIVADSSKIPATALPDTWLYDIPTVAGQEIELVSQDASTGIVEVGSTKVQAHGECYSLAGVRVNEHYRGIVVRDGRKYVNK
jgi:hypothetical protein